jgi:hypothetical protein
VLGSNRRCTSGFWKFRSPEIAAVAVAAVVADAWYR